MDNPSFLPEDAKQLLLKYGQRWRDQLDGQHFALEEQAELAQAKVELARLIDEHEKKAAQ